MSIFVFINLGYCKYTINLLKIILSYIIQNGMECNIFHYRFMYKYNNIIFQWLSEYVLYNM